MPSLDQYIKQIELLAKTLANKDTIKKRVTIVAAKSTEADYKERIFVDGKDSKGGNIGKYSTKPLYASKSNLKGLPKSKFKPKGKNGKSVFKNGKKKKTTYLKAGYKEFRDRSGRQSAKVDLNLTGSTFNSIQLDSDKDTIFLGFTSKENELIMEGNEKRFSKSIIPLSNKEEDTFIKVANREVVEIVKEILK
jgi:hypothetical protein